MTASAPARPVPKRQRTRWRPRLACRRGAADLHCPSEATGLDVAAAPIDLIDDGETVILFFRPSLLYIPASCSTGLVLIAMLALLLAYVAQAAWAPWTDVQAFAAGLAVGAARLGWQSFEWYSRVYILTDRRVIRRMGVIRVSLFETPLASIEHTSVFRRLRERALGVGTIGFATKGSDVFEALWVMIRRPFEVHRIVVEAIERYGQRGT